MVIRMPVQGISLQGRATMGVRVMKLKEKDKISAVARLIGLSEEERAVASRTLTSCPSPNGDIVDGNEDEGDGKDEESDGSDDDSGNDEV
jgi:hypothetical protein